MHGDTLSNGAWQRLVSAAVAADQGVFGLFRFLGVEGSACGFFRMGISVAPHTRLHSWHR